MSIEFSQIPERLNYPRHLKGKLSSLHSDVITYVSGIYDGSYDLRTRTIQLLNTLTRYVVDGDTFPAKWSSSSNPFVNIKLEDEFSLRDHLQNLYINPKNINWDVPIVVQSQEVKKKITTSATPIVPKSSTKKTSVKISKQTDKSDLYIQPPVVPQFDVSKPWMRTSIDGTVYCIYSSIPVIPTKQNEISVTTDVSMMSETQLLNLYPHNFIKTRSSSLYDSTFGFKQHDVLGSILPIEGFTEDEIVDNIIKYPHLFKLLKLKDGEVISFYNTLEIDGELHRISDVWKKLPDTSKIPYTADFVKEYVVRRYLLERDNHHVKHNYTMYGDLNPYLTLFTTSSDYIKWGYTDVVDIAKQCVMSRVAYKQSRNPVMRRIQNA